MPFRLRRSLVLAAVVGATVCATTACDADGEAPAAPGTAAGTPAGTPVTTPAGSPSASGAGRANTSPGAGGRDGTEEAVGDACTSDKVELEFADAGGTRPAVLLKATNISEAACTAYGIPAVGHPGAQAPVAAAPHADARAAVALDPGETAYAALFLPERGGHPHRATSFTLGLRGQDGAPLTTRATLKAPVEGLTVNDASRVTAWQAVQEDALG